MYKMNDFHSLNEEIKTHGLSHCGKLFCLLPTVRNIVIYIIISDYS